jgi:hypothetical protein
MTEAVDCLLRRYRTTARIWDLETKEIIKVIDMGKEAKVRNLGSLMR